MNLGWWYRLSIRDVFLEDEKQPGPPIVTLDAFVRAKDPIKTELSASSDVMVIFLFAPLIQNYG